MNYMKRQKGITLISLVITIIVLLILAGVAISMLSGENGILKKTAKASFFSDVGTYRDQLELYKYNWEIENKTNKQELTDGIKSTKEITTWEYEKIKKYINSFDNKYENKIGIVEGKLAFMDIGNQEETNWAREIGIHIQSQEAKITIDIDGKGTVNDLTEDGIIDTKVGATITLNAIAGKIVAEDGKEAVYQFEGWYQDGKTVSKELIYEFQVEGDTSIKAVFETDATVIYKGEQVKLDFSETLTGYANDTTITRVEVGNSCTSIGKEAFKDCENLKTVTANTINKVEINDSAFYNCANLTSVIFTNINLNGAACFASCSNLVNLQLGSKGKGVVVNKTAMTVSSSTNNKLIITVYLAESHISSRLPTAGTNATIYYYDESENLIEVSWGSYYSGDTSVEYVDIPDVTTEIRALAFKGCTNLKLTKLPKNLKTIGEKAFQNCTSLGAIEIPSTCIKIGVSAFANSGLTNITADTTNKVEINDSAFNSCANLTSAIFTNINLNGAACFASCSNLVNLQLGSKGKGVIVNKTAMTVSSSTNKKLIITVYLAESHISSRLPTAGTNATIYYYDESENLIEVSWGSYYSGDTSVDYVDIPDVTTEIRGSAFEGCTALKLTKLPSKLKTIGSKAFYNCKALSITQIPSTCTKIEASAFAESGLTNITADTTDKVEINDSAFYNCANLTSAIFTNINLNGSSCFASCSNLINLQLGSKGKGALVNKTAMTISSSTNKDLIVKLYLAESYISSRLPTAGTNATIYYYDESENLIDTVICTQ